MHDDISSKTPFYRLTTHGFIPDDEIWIKIGGDKRGKTMKMNFQITNSPLPNLPVNTVVFTAFEAPDSSNNLHVSSIDRYRDAAEAHMEV